MILLAIKMLTTIIAGIILVLHYNRFRSFALCFCFSEWQLLGDRYSLITNSIHVLGAFRRILMKDKLFVLVVGYFIELINGI